MVPPKFIQILRFADIRLQNIVSDSSYGTLPKISLFLIGSHGACTTRVSAWLGHTP